MAKFVALMFRTLPNEAHYKAVDRIMVELSKAGQSVHSAIAPLESEFNSWFAKETDCMAWYRKSALTALIADADHRLDHALVGMAAQVNAARYSADHNVSTAAENLYIMLHSYGNVHKMPYLQEIGAMKAILAHLNGDLYNDTQIVGLISWVNEITAAFNEFISLFEEREAQTLEKPEQGFAEVRREIEKVWHQIVTKVDAGAALNTSPDFDAFINALNPEFAYLNNEFHRAKHDITNAEPSPIPQQIYTGQPCTPVPEVFYKTPKETIKLVLGKDFNITYKHNINIGNADCIIHGKGAFKGNKTVTFIIKNES